ncbi:hypothetical protein [[Pseudomonas] boreopolis]|uniref:Uncharacterized protein n=1 Tax=Xanthomonas boreopolis TaxID=86183 RepID=A0A919F9Q2_9XANT|nr:hypothetical protein GCM10009090_25330 [[Pseudomonas] boreopolis]
MTTKFPFELDHFDNPQPDTSQSQVRTHSQQHGDANDAIEAIQAKVGINLSDDPESLDFKVGALQNVAEALDSAAFQPVSAFATSAQGEKADTAVQPDQLQATASELDGRIDDLEAAQASNAIYVGTWAELSSVAGTFMGQGAFVTTDPGTHTDPVSGATVSNAGQYRWTGSAWEWLRGDVLAEKADKTDARFPIESGVQGIVFAVTGANGEGTWLEANSEDGGPTAQSLELLDDATALLSKIPVNPRNVDGVLAALVGANGEWTWLEANSEDGGPTAESLALLQELLGGSGTYVDSKVAHPVAVKPRSSPIFSKAQSTANSIYWPQFVVDADGSVSLFYSTDHEGVHANSGIWRATAASPLDAFVDAGKVYRDDGGGNQTETPHVWWDERAQEWRMLYQQEGVGTGSQSTLWARADTLAGPWERRGICADWDGRSMGGGHTGYAKRFMYAGSEYMFSLYGGGNVSRFALWRRDDSKPIDSLSWIPDPRQIGRQKHLLRDYGMEVTGTPDATFSSGAIVSSISWKGISGDHFFWKGRLWWIGLIGPSAAGGVVVANQVGVAPVREDLMGLAEKPINITPPAQAWEGEGISDFGCVTVWNDRLFVPYRANGKTGSFGVLEII